MSTNGFITCPIHRQANAAPEHPAIVKADGKITWAELDATIAGSTHSLKQLGVAENSRVALLGGNSLAMISTIWALIRLGAVACPLSTRWPASKIASAIELIGADFLAVEADHTVEKATSIPCFDFGELSESTNDLPTNLQLRPLNHATIIFTSGSEGDPKAAVHTLQNHLNSAAGVNQRLQFGPVYGIAQCQAAFDLGRTRSRGFAGLPSRGRSHSL